MVSGAKAKKLHLVFIDPVAGSSHFHRAQILGTTVDFNSRFSAKPLLEFMTNDLL